VGSHFSTFKRTFMTCRGIKLRILFMLFYQNLAENCLQRILSFQRLVAVIHVVMSNKRSHFTPIQNNW
jgi:hypothetical protein